jgi:hypothetical protein
MRFPPPRNPFAYPGGSVPARLNPRNFTNMRMACVAHGAGASMRDLLTGYVAPPNPLGGTRFESNIIGPTCYPFGSNANASYLSFPNPIPGEVFVRTTMACIFVNNSAVSATGQALIGDNTAGPQAKLVCQGTNPAPMLIFSIGGTNPCQVPYQYGHPYFVVGSMWHTSPLPNVRILSVDLFTGQVQFAQGNAGGGGIASGTNYSMLTYGPGTGGSNVIRVACGMIAMSYLSFNQMAEWAQDPWSLWYAPINLARATESNPNFVDLAADFAV